MIAAAVMNGLRSLYMLRATCSNVALQQKDTAYVSIYQPYIYSRPRYTCKVIE